jgi:hypothetical protein
MNGAYTLLGECLLLAFTLLASLTVWLIGRRVAYPASVAAYSAAVAALVADPLLSVANLHRVDRVVGIVGAGLLLVHLAFMVRLGGLLLLYVLATQSWSFRHHLAIGGSCLLTAVFVLLWLVVKTLPLPDVESVFYHIRAGWPPAVLWMNVSMGAGLVYIAAWSLVEFTHFLRSARTTYEHGLACVAMLLYALAGVGGTLTLVETLGHATDVDITGVQRVKGPFALVLVAAAACVWVSQIWLRPLWRQRRQLLLRYLEPDLVQLRNDLLNLSAVEAELHLDMHPAAYANRVMVEAVAARCRAAGIAPARVAIARMATCLLTFQREHLRQDPTDGRSLSWEALMQEAAAEIDQTIAATAWAKAMRNSYVTQHVYIVMFLVLDSRTYRERLLLDERPRIRSWHVQLADLIATVMQEHGHATPRAIVLAQRRAARTPWAWLRARWAARRRDTLPRPSPPAPGDGGPAEGGARPT